MQSKKKEKDVLGTVVDSYRNILADKMERKMDKIYLPQEPSFQGVSVEDIDEINQIKKEQDDITEYTLKDLMKKRKGQ